ncbi:MAG: hypothetical protein GY769_04370 [bacterium]|nr:hypothetical protein [bacterium]
MDPRIAVALAGGFGGVAPNIFRVASRLTGGADLPGASYLIGMLMFSLMGAAIALAFEERELKKAFFLGLGLPAMFQSGVNDLSQANGASLLPRTPIAYAAMSQAPPRPVVFLAADVPPYNVVFSSTDGKRREIHEVEHPEKDNLVMAPGWTSSFVVTIGESASDPERLPPPDEEAEYRLEVRRKAWSGLKQAVGMKEADEYELAIVRAEKDNR